ncbi:MAG: hypothetical protein ACRYHA_10320 [Janthinobacterium lividum]
MHFEIRSSGNQNVTSGYGFPLNADPQGVPDDVRNIVQEILALLKVVAKEDAASDAANEPSMSATPATASTSTAQATTPSSAKTDTHTNTDTNTDTDTDTDTDTQGTALEKNAGGVAQARAIIGIDPKSSQVLQTGTGSDKTFNYTNNTDRTESVRYSVKGDTKATMTLKPGETGSFVAGSGDIGVRISPSDAQGNTHPDEVLYEDGGAGNGQSAGAGNPDVSKVDGDKDFNGHASKLTITLSDGRTAGDGDAIRAYMNPTDDAAAMGLAGDASKTVNIVQSDA